MHRSLTAIRRANTKVMWIEKQEAKLSLE